jgi:phage terminase large subunit-like protein
MSTGFFANNVPDDAFQEISTLSNQGHNLTCVAFTPGGGSLVLFDQNGYWASNVPNDALQEIGNLSGQGRTLKWVAFTPANGWMIIYE